MLENRVSSTSNVSASAASKLAPTSALLGLNGLPAAPGLFHAPLAALHNMAEMKLAGATYPLLPTAAALCRALGPPQPRPPTSFYTSGLAAAFASPPIMATPHGISDILGRSGIVYPTSSSSLLPDTGFPSPRKPADITSQVPLYWSAVLQNAAAWRSATGTL